MAATNYTIVRRNRKNNTILLDTLEYKWTYKQALAIAKEASTEAFELVCVVETSRILPENEKKSENKEELPIG